MLVLQLIVSPRCRAGGPTCLLLLPAELLLLQELPHTDHLRHQHLTGPDESKQVGFLILLLLLLEALLIPEVLLHLLLELLVRHLLLRQGRLLLPLYCQSHLLPPLRVPLRELPRPRKK